MPQLDALRFARDEEAHGRDVNQCHLAQVEYEQRLVPPDVGLEFVQILRLDATDEPQRRGLAVERCFDLQGPLRESSALTWRKDCKRRAMADYFQGGQLAPTMMPTDQQLPNGRHGWPLGET